ncbi:MULTISPECIES: hypothetical protein [Corynebacterium]|uniref:hypothetical protein n=1 Tax=Corynebacterium TaxID=1716 RepID=UPI000831F766|nr:MULTISPECIES: hypothetical protein [Corynebacterium]
MTRDHAEWPEPAPRHHEREDLDDISPSSPQSPRDDPRDNAANADRNPDEGVEDGGPKHPTIDDALLAELVDDDDSPEDKAKKVAIVEQVISQYHSGPLPSAEEFGRYKDIEPTAPQIILDMAAQATTAAANRENAIADVMRANARIDEKAVPRGQYISAVLILGLLTIALVALVLDREWIVLLFGVGGLGMMFMNTLPTLLNRDHSPRALPVEKEALERGSAPEEKHE